VRRSSQLICVLAAAYSAWIGIAYFAWLMPGMHFSWLWAAIFTLQAVLLAVAAVVLSDLVIRPRKDLASGQPVTLTFSAWGPFWPWVMSNSTFCPSSRLGAPPPVIALTCTNTSGPPSAAMKP
jgi:hypothetical protein